MAHRKHVSASRFPTVVQLALFVPDTKYAEQEVASWTPAVQRIWTALRAVTPKGIPAPIVAVISARTTGDVTRARVIMADGLVARVRVSTWGIWHGWEVAWEGPTGGALMWDGMRWKRVPSLDESDETVETKTRRRPNQMA